MTRDEIVTALRCGFVITTEGSWDKPTKKYCEDCGAKMDGGDSDAAD